MDFLEKYDFPELEGDIPGDIYLGTQGKPGATFIPTVDEAGNLSWSNNGNLKNPETVNVKGKPFTYEDFTKEQLDALKGQNGGHYIPAVTQPDESTLQFAFTPSKTGMPAVEPVTVELPGGTGSGGNVAYDEAQNLTDEQKAQARENIGAQPKGNYLTEHQSLEGYAKTEDIPTDEHINSLINAALGVIENGTY